MKCLCGLRKEYAACCGPYLEGKKKAPNPEALMRSRYTAFAKGNMDYIEKTMRGEALEKFDKASARAQVGDTEYLKLDVLFSEEQEDRGTVQFIVTFRYKT